MWNAYDQVVTHTGRVSKSVSAGLIRQALNGSLHDNGSASDK